MREALKQTSQGASDGRYQMVFVLKCCMLCGQSLSRNVGGLSTRRPPPPPPAPSMKHINDEMKPLAV